MREARVFKGLWKTWLSFGGEETLASYAPPDREGRFDDVPEEHWEFFERSCRDYYETETHFFVHANADPQLPLDKQSAPTLVLGEVQQPAAACFGQDHGLRPHGSKERSAEESRPCRMHRHLGLRRGLADVPRCRKRPLLAGESKTATARRAPLGNSHSSGQAQGRPRNALSNCEDDGGLPWASRAIRT